MVLDFEAIGADEIFIESHAGNKKLNNIGNLKGKHIKSTFSFKADSASSGFDLVAQTSHKGKVKKAEQRIYPKIVRRVKLTVPLQWNNLSKLPKQVKITCGMLGVWKGKVVSPGKTTKIQLLLEDIVRASEDATAKLKYYCSAKHSTDTLLSYGHFDVPTNYTYANWPVSELSITTKTFEIKGW